MKTHTNQFKSQIAKFAREHDSVITYDLNGETIELGGDKLNSITPSFKSSILKSAMKQLDIDSNEDIPLNTIINYKFGIKINGSYEYLDFGNYVVYKSERQEDTLSYKITCYDKMLYAMQEYEDLNISYPITIRNYINAICTKLGLTFANASDTFANYDKQIQNELYLDSDGNSLGYTYRDVLDELAQVTASTICINDDDELEIRYITETNDTIDENYFKNINVTFGEKYGKINSIVLSRSGGSDNVYLRDEQSVIQDGLCELKIADNQIMNFNDRSTYLTDILNQLDGLEYYINDFSSTGICYYDICDRYTVQIGENTYSCIMFNDEINVTQGLEENVYTELPEESETDYTKADKTDRKINQTYLMVDKQNGIIQSLVDSTTYVSDTKSGVGSITLENAHKGQLYKLSIKGQISLIFPSLQLYPNLTGYTKSNVLIIDNNEYKLDFDYLNYISNIIADEFVYENGECKIIRRVGVDGQGNKYALSNEIVENRKPVILNVESNSTISLKSFDTAIISATYLLQNDITSNFATEAYVNSSITQTANTINLEVASKLDGEDFTGANIMLQINRDESQAQINADKISLNGKTINLTGDNVNISSNKFSVDSNGNMQCSNATITGGTLNIANNTGASIITLTDTRNNAITTISGNDYKTIANNGDYYELSGNVINFNQTNGYASSLDAVAFQLDYGSSYTIITATNGVDHASRAEYKKNIEVKNNNLELIKQCAVYSYLYNEENNNSKKHIGLIIGKEYNTPKEITNARNDGILLYDMCGVMWGAIKEQQQIIEDLKEKINKLEKDSDK